MSGVAEWLPSSAPGATSFFNVDRSVDSRLGGLRLDASNKSIEDATIIGQSVAYVNGGKPDVIWFNPTDFRELEQKLGSKAHYSKLMAKSAEKQIASIGYDALEVHGDNGIMKIISDRDVPVHVAYALEMETWLLISAGEVPHLLDDDKNRVLRVVDDDAYEVRLGLYGNLACSAPGNNVRITLPTG
jgi:hypothetical protein